MGEIFHHLTDVLVHDHKCLELVVTTTVCMALLRWIKDRVFSRRSIKMRENVEQLLFFYHRDRVRFCELNRELACLCFQLDEANSKRREVVDRTRALEKENAELIEQVSGLATSLVQVTLERNRRGPSLANWKVFGRFIALAVVMVGYVCAKTFIP